MITPNDIDIAAWQPLLSAFTASIGAVSGYYGSKAAMMVQIAKVESAIAALQKDHDSDHAKLDALRDEYFRTHGVKRAD